MSNSYKIKLACQEHLIPGDSLIEKWSVISKLGYAGIELRGEGDFALEKRLPELLAAKEAGVIFSSVCVIMGHFFTDADLVKRADAMANMKSLLSVCAKVGALGVVTPAAYGVHSNYLPPFESSRAVEQDQELLVAGLKELGEYAKSEGVKVLIEPLNRYEDHMLNTLEQAHTLCEKVDMESVKFMADLFHMGIEEQNSVTALKSTHSQLAHMHLADSNRFEPGQGHTDFAPIIDALEEINFEGYLALECMFKADELTALTNTAKIIL